MIGVIQGHGCVGVKVDQHEGYAVMVRVIQGHCCVGVKVDQHEGYAVMFRLGSMSRSFGG